MKLITENECFVDINDLLREKVPNYLILDRLADGNNMAVFKDVKTIEYVKSRDDIIDYNDVCSLSDRELNKIINKITKKLTTCYDKKKYKDNELNYDKYTYLYNGLVDYKNNKEEIDLKMNNIIDNNKKSIKTKVKILNN